MTSANFWTHERRSRLRAELKNAMNVLRMSPEKLAAAMNDANGRYEAGEGLGKRTLERFIADQVETQAESLKEMIVGLAKHVASHEVPSADRERMSGLANLHKEFLEIGLKARRSPSRGEEASGPEKDTQSRSVSPPSTPTEVAKLAELFLSYLYLPKNASTAASEMFFYRRSSAKKLYFDTYRFSSRPGFIQKSFTVINRAPPGIPVATFQNFYDHNGRVRSSSGGVIMFVHTPVLIGQSDQGKSPKIMIFDTVKSHQSRYSGLMFTHEPAGEPVACRFLMKESDFDRHTPAATRLDKIGNFVGELNDEEIDGLRNRVDFLPEKKIYDSKGDLLRATDVAYIVGGLLKQAGVAQLQDDSGALYNPADPTNFTFNAALKVK